MRIFASLSLSSRNRFTHGGTTDTEALLVKEALAPVQIATHTKENRLLAQ
jgi:hypothetical protein